MRTTVDIDAARTAIESIVGSLRETVAETSRLKWHIDDGLLPILLRSAVRRQFESLEAISRLVADEQGFAAAPLLRPACEELLWIKYLLKIENAHAETLVQCIGHDEVIKALRKQRTAVGKAPFKELGLAKHLRDYERTDKRIRDRLRQLSRSLQWPVRPSEKEGAIPPMSWVADKVEETDTYNLVYHATSRFVHFSPTELLRRAWYLPQKRSIKIDSQQFDKYWGYFSLYWGLLLFLRTTSAAADEINMDVVIDSDRVLRAAKRLGRIGKPPIITAEELRWKAT